MLIKPQWALGDEFPAANALLGFRGIVPGLRPTAVNHLVNAIGNPSVPELVRANAAEVLFFLNDDPSRSVGALTQASKAAGPEGAELLRDAARKLAARCRSAEMRAACEAALN